MTEYLSRLEKLQKAIRETEGVINVLDRRALEGAYQAFANNPETEIVGSVARNLRDVLGGIDLYRYNPIKDESQILTPRKALIMAIAALEEIVSSQQKHI